MNQLMNRIEQISRIHVCSLLKIGVLAVLFLSSTFSLWAQKPEPERVDHQSAFTVKVYGSGTPVYLIPGLASGGEVYQGTVNRLKDRYECYVFTLAGFAGEKPIAQKPYLKTIKKALESYIEKHGKGIIIGHSLGGFLALQMIAENTNLARKAVIVDTYPFLAALRQPGATEATVHFPRKMMIKQMQQMDSTQFRRQEEATLSTMISDSENLNTALKWAMESDRPTVVNAMADMMQIDFRDELKKIKTPTLIMIAGNISTNGHRIYNEQQIRNVADLQYKNLKNKTIKIANNAKHFIMMDDPQWFYQTLETYLNAK